MASITELLGNYLPQPVPRCSSCDSTLPPLFEHADGRFSCRDCIDLWPEDLPTETAKAEARYMVRQVRHLQDHELRPVAGCYFCGASGRFHA